MIYLLFILCRHPQVRHRAHPLCPGVRPQYRRGSAPKSWGKSHHPDAYEVFAKHAPLCQWESLFQWQRQVVDQGY